MEPISWEKLLKCDACEVRDMCGGNNSLKAFSWEVFITWLFTVISIVVFWVGVVYGIIKIVYWLRIL